LDAGILREYIAKLGDFEEFDAMDQAIDVAKSSPHASAALAFLTGWPLLDQAAALVLERRTGWDGRHYDALISVASALEENYPLTATVLVRALLNDILGRGRSQAYDHAAYLLRLRKDHGRKTGFWSRVAG